MSFMSLTAAIALLTVGAPAPSTSTSTTEKPAVAAARIDAATLAAFRDQAATFTLNDGRVVSATILTRTAGGYIVAVGADVVTLADDDIKKLQMTVTGPDITTRRASLEARVAALETLRPGSRFSPVDIAVGDSPVLGPRDAPITVVAFIDLLSPSSAQVVPLWRAIVDDARFKGRFRVVVKQRPIVDAANARDVARLMLAVHTIGGDAAYFKLASAIAANIDGATPLAIMVAAEQLGIARATLGSTVRRDVAALDARIDDDLALARLAGANRSPTIFVDGWRLDRLDLEGLRALIAEHRL